MIKRGLDEYFVCPWRGNLLLLRTKLEKIETSQHAKLWFLDGTETIWSQQYLNIPGFQKKTKEDVLHVRYSQFDSGKFKDRLHYDSVRFQFQIFFVQLDPYWR